MSLRLTFVGSGESFSTDYRRGTMDFALPGSRPRPSEFIEGGTATEILDAWNALPWWATYDSAAFRERVVGLCGADDPKFIEEPIELPASDEEILDAVVAAAGPDSLKLERV